ncbi:MAG: hypothetical protein AAF631_01210 [Pseudomonadota bacterium]
MADSRATVVRIRFEGEGHADAADAFLVQYADGGLEDAIEERLDGQGFAVLETDFDMDGRVVIVSVEDQREGLGEDDADDD